jgi:hypothetical protein
MKKNIFLELRKVLKEDDIQMILNQISAKTKLVLTSNPEEFEDLAREYEDTLSHSWAGSSTTKKTTEVLHGDFEPGLDYTYQYSNNGNVGLPEEKHIMSDFTLNEVQIAKISSLKESTFQGDYSDEEPAVTLAVYMPEEKEIGEFTSFKEMILAKKAEALSEKIRESVGTALTDEEIRDIVRGYDFEDPVDIDVSVTSNPEEFDTKARPYRHEISHSWAGTDLDERISTTALGDYEPGMYSYYQYSDNGNIEPEEIEEELSEFSLRNVQVVNTEIIEDDSLNEPYNNSRKLELVIYIPNEKELPGFTKFSELAKSKKNATQLGEEIEEIASPDVRNAVTRDIVKMAENELKADIEK